MSRFHQRAWMSGAEEYGRVRAEKYGRWARFLLSLQITAGIALACGTYYFWSVGHGQ